LFVYQASRQAADLSTGFTQTGSQLDVRFTAQTDDNELIYVRYNGVIQCSKEQLDRIQKGEILKANDCYWATAPVFETKSGKYGWLRACLAEFRLRRQPPMTVTAVKGGSDDFG